MLRTLIVSVLFFLLIPAAIFAAQPEAFLIEDVTIQVKGLTQKQLLEREMDFDLDKRFSSIEELEKYVTGRKQILINMRIFDAVESTIIEGSEPGSYSVHIFVDDAFTMLPLPYAKYDSNYGLKVGLKLFDKNLLGTLSDMKLTSFMTQTPDAPNSWETKQYFTELIWDNIPLLGSTLDTTTKFNIKEGEASGFQSGTVQTSLLLKDLPLFSNKFSMRANISAEQLIDGEISRWGNPDYDISFSWSRLPFFDKTVTIGAKWDLYSRNSETGVETYDINFDTTFHDQDLLFFDIDVLAGLKYRFSGNDLPRTLEQIYLGIRDSYSLPFSTKLTSTTKLITSPWVFDDTRFIFSNTLSGALPFSLRFSITPVLTVYTDSYTDAGLTLTNRLSRNRIDWSHNFRKGLSFSASNTLGYNTYNYFDRVELTSSYNSLTSTSFIILGGWLNLGSRISAYYAYNSVKYFMNDSALRPGELMRGILDKSIINEVRSFGSVINTNATITFIDLDGKAELLASVFLDAGIFSATDTFEELELHLSGGVEGALIFDKFKSYPFNVTIGANLMDVYAYMKNEIPSIWDIEYEILMSLELFY